ncbi:hypothetical protein C0J52_01870 [Blattella germanica]|nr:hypothetical protein C0J52_01870 [Blattella germanica]
MCIKVISNLSFGFRNSYCVTRAIVNTLKITNLQRNKCSVMGYVPSILSKKISTQIECEPDIKDKKGNAQSEDRITQKGLEIKTKRRRQTNKEILDYMNSKKSLKSVLNDLPEKILKRKKGTPEALYVVDKNVAKIIAKEIISDSNNRSIPVFEINPGPGILSRELLATGIQNLSLCEPSSFFLEHMEKLEAEYPSQVQIIQQDFLSLAKLTYQDHQDGGTRVQKLFSNVPKVKWTDEPVMRVIGVLPSIMFIRHLMKSHIFQTGIMTYGRPEFYVVLSPSHHFRQNDAKNDQHDLRRTRVSREDLECCEFEVRMYLTCGREAGYFNYRSISVLFQLIFDWHLIKKLPREGFLPWEVKYRPKKWSKLTKLSAADVDSALR